MNTSSFGILKIIIRSVLIVWLLLEPINIYAGTIIIVKDQKGFNEVQDRILECINHGERKITVTLYPGQYIASEKHISLNGIQKPDVSIRIIGKKGSCIVPEGREYRNGESYNGVFSINNSWTQGALDLSNWSSIRYADGLIEVLDVNSKTCRIRSREPLHDTQNIQNAFIMIPAWYQSYIYPIFKIERDYIYFTADNLKISYNNGYNVNNDYNYGRKGIRYKLTNVETGDDYVRVVENRVLLPAGVITAREGKTHTVVSVKNCSIKSFELSNIQFSGSSFSLYSPLIFISDTKTNKTSIHYCAFSAIRGNVIKISSSPNVQVSNNSFENCYYNGIIADNTSENIKVTKNVFRSMGDRLLGSFCILCNGENYYIANNKISDYGYGGISVGEWYGNVLRRPSYGIVEYNELIYTDAYIADIDDHGIMDGGAIYISTKNDGAIVRYNIIRNYTGIKDNRGIFCDDGAYNFQIYGNIITGNYNSYCIDSRRVKNVEASKSSETGIERSNINNIIRDNVVEGSIRFEGHEDADNGCYRGSNYLLSNNDNVTLKSVYMNVNNDKEDVTLSCYSEDNGIVILSRSDYKRLKRLDNWKQIKRFIKRK